ncbi:hypothetical protein K501DRAFT_6940 [Backusella circina FSU 941]|nr:hypothetical protein K501DRAFT_6940 [Backusella circina FSU 941]
MKFSATICTLTAFALIQSASAQSATCSDQTVIDTCASNQDIYLKTCADADYPCLCKWHTAKLSCYDSCLLSGARASEKGLKDTFCSIAQTYSTNTSSVVPSIAPATLLPSSSLASALPSASSSTVSTKASSDSVMTYDVIGQSVFMFVAATTTFMFL